MWDFPFDKGVSVGDGIVVGAVLDHGSSHGIIVSNCLIYACNAGVMSKSLCDVSVRNCTIVENDSGLTNYNKVIPPHRLAAASRRILTTTSFGTTSQRSGSRMTASSSPITIFSEIRTGQASGNIDVDPLFVNPATRDYRLQAGSPALTSGRDGAYMGVTYPLGGIPARPLRLAVQANGTNELALTWIDDSQNEDGVVVQRSTDGMNWIQIATLGADATNYTDATAFIQQKYYYRVQHTNYAGLSPYSNIGGGTRQGATIFVGGTISANTLWPSGSIIVVTSSVTVAASVTLTIEPCVRVQFNQGISLTVNGLLIAEGTPECRIVFTRNAGATSWGTH